MDNDITFILKLTDVQCRALINNLRSTTRLLLGDFNELKTLCYRNEIGFVDHDEFKHISHELMDTFHPDLVQEYGYNSNWGIGNKSIPDADILFDIAKLLEYEISWRDNLVGDWGCSYDKPLGWSGQPLIVEHTDPLLKIYISFFRRLNHSITQMIRKRGWKPDTPEYNNWIQKCKDFAIYENNHIVNTNTPLPNEEYLTFFNEKLDENGKYILWIESDLDVVESY